MRFTSYSIEKKRSLGSVNPAIGFGIVGVLFGAIPVLMTQSFAKVETFEGYKVTKYIFTYFELRDIQKMRLKLILKLQLFDVKLEMLKCLSNLSVVLYCSV